MSLFKTVPWHESGGTFRQVVWIPKPCGIAGESERMELLGEHSRGKERGRTTEVRCRWTRYLMGPAWSKLAGMWSELYDIP